MAGAEPEDLAAAELLQEEGVEVAEAIVDQPHHLAGDLDVGVTRTSPFAFAPFGAFAAAAGFPPFSAGGGEHEHGVAPHLFDPHGDLFQIAVEHRIPTALDRDRPGDPAHDRERPPLPVEQ